MVPKSSIATLTPTVYPVLLTPFVPTRWTLFNLCLAAKFVEVWGKHSSKYSCVNRFWHRRSGLQNGILSFTQKCKVENQWLLQLVQRLLLRYPDIFYSSEGHGPAQKAAKWNLQAPSFHFWPWTYSAAHFACVEGAQGFFLFNLYECLRGVRFLKKQCKEGEGSEILSYFFPCWYSNYSQ